jgi:hypothetical protein
MVTYNTCPEKLRSKDKINKAARLHAMKAYGGIHAKIHSFFTLSLVEGVWSALRSSRFTSGEITVGIQ